MVHFRREVAPTCHAFSEANDDADLLVGLSNGEGKTTVSVRGEHVMEGGVSDAAVVAGGASGDPFYVSGVARGGVRRV